ncbi:hypothetical protein OAJ44_00775 [Chloroflexi bacterium]|nr:hypothetical protein [Chloroflexota bacterium]
MAIQEDGIYRWFQDATTDDFTIQQDGYFGFSIRIDPVIAKDKDWLRVNPQSCTSYLCFSNLGVNPSR